VFSCHTKHIDLTAFWCACAKRQNMRNVTEHRDTCL